MSEVKKYKNGDHVPAGMEDEAYDQMTEKQDFVDNAIFTLMTTLAESVGKKVEWNIASIAEIRETVLDGLAEAGIFVPYPGLEEIDDDNPEAGSIWREYECDPEDYEDDDEEDEDVSAEGLQGVLDDLQKLAYNINAVTSMVKAMCTTGLLKPEMDPDQAATRVHNFLCEAELEELQSLKSAFANSPDMFKKIFKEHIALQISKCYPEHR